MTVKEFYEHCKKIGAEDFPIFMDYACEDDYYSCGQYLEKRNIKCRKTNSFGEDLPTTSLILRMNNYD